MNWKLGSILIATLFATSILAQESPTTLKAAQTRIIHGPELELSRGNLTMIRWTTNNPGGSPVHYGIVHYGTDPKNLSQTAKNPIRLNHHHTSTVFRVRMVDLKPATTCYYTVESIAANGTSDGVKCTVNRITTPASQ
jgi:hypothetical protein